MKSSPMLAVPAMPMAEYSSLRNTFSTSRLEIMLPAVARRSPASTTPWLVTAATIVVACGRLAITSAFTPLSWLAPGIKPGEYVARKSVNDGVCRRMKSGMPCAVTCASHQYPATTSQLTLLPRRARKRQSLSAHGEPAERPYWPPFWTYERTNASAFSSRTSSISSRMASTSSDSFSWRSRDSSLVPPWVSSVSSARRVVCRWPPVSLLVAISLPPSSQSYRDPQAPRPILPTRNRYELATQ